MSEKYKLLIYPEAQEEINSTFEYISASLGSPSAALALIRSLENAIENVRLFPHSCAVYKQSYGLDTRRLVVNKFIAFYIADDNNKTIRIMRFIYGARNIEQLL